MNNATEKGEQCTFPSLNLFMIKLKRRGKKANKGSVKEMSRDIKARREHIATNHFTYRGSFSQQPLIRTNRLQ